MRSKRILLGLITLCFVILCGFGVQTQETKRARKPCLKTPMKTPPPWFNPVTDLNSKARPQILSTGEFGENGTVVCKNIFLFCGHTLTKYKTLKDNSGTGEHCPTSNDFSLPEIDCAKLDQAVKSKQPCDPQIDANCNGIPNADDPDPLFFPFGWSLPQDYVWVDSPSGEASIRNYDNKRLPVANCTRLKVTDYLYELTSPSDGQYAVVDNDPDFGGMIDDKFVSCEPPPGCSSQSGPAPKTSPTPASTPTSSTGGASGSTGGTPSQTNSRASISGKVTSKDGTRLSDVRVLLSGSMSAETRTNASGNYSFDNLVANASSSYRVRPVRSDSNFSPSLRGFNPLNQNQTANFAALGGAAAEIAAARSGSSYELKPNPTLKGQTGQLVFSLVDKDALGGVMIAPGDRLVFVGSEIPLPPGDYDITVNGALLRAVPIQPGMDTSIKIGVLNLSVAADIYDQTKTKELMFMTAGKIALPVGTYNLKIDGVFKPVLIRDKQVTDF